MDFQFYGKEVIGKREMEIVWGQTLLKTFQFALKG